MDAVANANHQFELQRQAFIYADIKSEMLQAFRGSAQAVIFMDDGENARYVPIDPKVEPIYDDKMDSSFKVGDNFQCKIRENSKERWFQIKYDKTFINLRDPERYFKREEDGFEFFIFTALTGISIVMLSPQVLDYPKMKKVLNRVSNSIIGFDKHGSTYLKRGVK
jgi:hypothetical protein